MTGGSPEPGAGVPADGIAGLNDVCGDQHRNVPSQLHNRAVDCGLWPLFARCGPVATVQSASVRVIWAKLL